MTGIGRLGKASSRLNEDAAAGMAVAAEAKGSSTLVVVFAVVFFTPWQLSSVTSSDGGEGGTIGFFRSSFEGGGMDLSEKDLGTPGVPAGVVVFPTSDFEEVVAPSDDFASLAAFSSAAFSSNCC